ncbi:predicted protein [Chaetomium globosum CBS 148.51]|uniref:Uncharacterized protein n=1 Tax=Chaetomium globosum (strain ATCC 6205 / CBS 148.51 / DSM 1962 / NBRC 6347 / NRRL 1970) TaxID=306901 RepID=Q2GQJ2_CHAGB|nr:uncharacterized protein CHGG_09762 [Chaetomium globosum CBS 148.51]EAQ83358.1 predicted protein [Chaetomium globosum CBS 148.51]
MSTVPVLMLVLMLVLVNWKPAGGPTYQKVCGYMINLDPITSAYAHHPPRGRMSRWWVVGRHKGPPQGHSYGLACDGKLASDDNTTDRPQTPPDQQISESGSLSKSGTPATKSYPVARGTAENLPSADEAYVNTALLLLLQAVTQDFRHQVNSLHWAPPRMALHLRVPALGENKKYAKMDLLEARVDGYLCSISDNGSDAGLDKPLAICEAKSAVRHSIKVATERQEAAEMAAWICRHSGNEGLLQSSASGRKR